MRKQIFLFIGDKDHTETIDDYNKYLVKQNVNKYIEISDVDDHSQKVMTPVYLIVEDEDNNNKIVFDQREIGSYSLTNFVKPLMTDDPHTNDSSTSNKRRRTSSSRSRSSLSSKSRSASSRSRRSPSSKSRSSYKSPESMSSNKRRRTTSKSRGVSKRN